MTAHINSHSVSVLFCDACGVYIRSTFTDTEDTAWWGISCVKSVLIHTPVCLSSFQRILPVDLMELIFTTRSGSLLSSISPVIFIKQPRLGKRIILLAGYFTLKAGDQVIFFSQNNFSLQLPYQALKYSGHSPFPPVSPLSN